MFLSQPHKANLFVASCPHITQSYIVSFLPFAKMGLLFRHNDTDRSDSPHSCAYTNSHVISIWDKITASFIWQNYCKLLTDNFPQFSLLFPLTLPAFFVALNASLIMSAHSKCSFVLQIQANICRVN